MILRIFFVAFYCLLLWLICFINTGNDRKNLRGLRSYPRIVRDIVRNDPQLGKIAPVEANKVKILLSNFILFTVIFLVPVFVIKFESFLDAFLYILILGEVLNFFDYAVIDLLWWRNIKRIRFSCAPGKELYQDITEHTLSFLRGILMYLFVALADAGIWYSLFMT